MANPQQPAQPQQPQQPAQTQGTAGQGGQPSQFNPGALLQLLADVTSDEARNVIVKITTDLVNVFKGQPVPVQGAGNIACGPNGNKDKNACCDRLIETLTQSIALAAHCRCYC
jgi:hypothetical protein